MDFGQWVDSQDGATAESTNPSTGASLGTFADAQLADGEAAIAAADCFETSGWAHQPRLRAQVLLKFADNLEAAKSDIANALARENGKLIGESMHEVAAAVSEARYYAGLARNIFGGSPKWIRDSFRCSRANLWVSPASSCHGMRLSPC